MVSPYIVDIEIVAHKSKTFAIMPLMPTTLEHLVIREADDALKLYVQMKNALLALHLNSSHNIKCN